MNINNLLILIGIYFLSSFIFYKVLSRKNFNEEIEDNMRVEEDFHIINEEKNDSIEDIIEKVEIKYELQTHKVKYSFFNEDKELNYCYSNLYKIVVRKKLWINEPFHSKFYEILLLISSNNFMIIDRNTRVLTMNVRDSLNKVRVSHSYQVYSSKEIIEFIIRKSLDQIQKYVKNDAQNIIFAIVIFYLKKSVHFTSKEVLITTVNELFKGYKYKSEIDNILNLIEKRDSRLNFIREVSKEAFCYCQTYPFNDSEIPKNLYLPNKTSEKSLQSI